jgi:RNA polymerase II subunit A-like phosphatase
VEEQQVGVGDYSGHVDGDTNTVEQEAVVAEQQVGGTVSENSGSSDSSSDSSDSSSSSGIDDSIFDQLLEGETSGGGVGDKKELSVGASQASEHPSSGGVPRAAPVGSEGGGMPQVSSPSADAQGWRGGAREIHDPDNFLLHLVSILERTHSIFYHSYDAMSCDATTTPSSTHSDPDPPIPDLKHIIPELRHSILSDCRVLFTGVIPTNIPVRKNPEWNTARAFGATIHTQLVPGLNSSNPDDVKSATTHVIAGKPGTSKLQEARRMPEVKIVNTKWLWACAEQWKKVDEELYSVEADKRRLSGGSKSKIPKKVAIVYKKENGGGKNVTPPAPVTTTVPQGDPESSESEVEDDDIFRNSSFSELAMMDTTELKRHLSIESRLSVSDEELGRMDAEVDAEISSSSSDGSERGKKEGLGSHVEIVVDNEDELSYEKFAGTDSSHDIDVVERLNRKRRFAELDASDSTDSLMVEHLNESPVSDNDAYDDDSGDDGDDELGALLGFGGGDL